MAQHLTLADGPAARQLGPGQGAGYLVAHHIVGGTAHNLAQLAFTRVYLADVEVVAAFHGSFFHDLSHDHQIGGDAALLNALYLNTGKGEHIGHLFGVQTVQIDVVGKPIQGDIHTDEKW